MHCTERKNNDKILNKFTFVLLPKNSVKSQQLLQRVLPPSTTQGSLFKPCLPLQAYSFLVRRGQFQLPVERGKDFSSLCSLSSIILINVKLIPFLSKCKK